MFVFEKEQFIYDVGGIKIGGNLGENPTALAGTIFYSGDKIVRDAKQGIFDEKVAEDLILQQDTMAHRTGNPAIIQIFAESAIAMKKYIDFVTDISDSPIIIDSADASVRIAGMQHAEEIGLLDRAIYNSINVSVTSEEIQALMDMKHSCAIVLVFNPQDPSIAGRRAILDEGGGGLKEGLLSLAKRIGISKPLLDTATTAMGAGAGSSASFTFVAKTVYGYPTGSGIHNAPSSWTWLRKLKKENKLAYQTCDIASNLIVQMLGADYVLYGPISNADRVFPVVAMADVFAAESAKMEFGIEPSEDHPFRKLV
ncbi:MAG: Tetrahydromethanopterin S-methyltransferase subunit H [Candidatus Thorarchaeota archaeon]|nr:MAG: Tetrahydromethanopterin S-methyltransferase subunit H [Candidatus Thorarchaeota archaeon]